MSLGETAASFDAAGAPSCYLIMPDKLMLATSLEPMVHLRNEASLLSLFNRYHFGRRLS